MFERPIPCYYPFTHIAISFEGFLTVCNEDALNKMAVLDINNMTLKDAWYSQEMKEIRKKHLQKNVNDLQCYNCSNGTNIDIPALNEQLFQQCLI